MSSGVFSIHNENHDLLGTGFAIKRDEQGVHILTCYHVVKSSDELYLKDLTRCSISQVFPKSDLATLLVEKVDCQLLDLQKFKSVSNASIDGYTNYLGGSKKEKISNIKVNDGVELDLENIEGKAFRLDTEQEIKSGYSGSEPYPI